MLTRYSTSGDLARLHHRTMTIEHPTPVVVMASRHRTFWLVVRLMGLLIALLILPVLIVLNLLLYGDLAGCRAGDHRLAAPSRSLGARSRCCRRIRWKLHSSCPLVAVWGGFGHLG